MTSSQLITAARAKILEDTEEIIADSILYLYANLTYQDVQLRIFPNSQILSATISFVSGVGSLPSDFGTMYGDALQGTSNIFPELSIDDFNKHTLSQAVTIESGQMKVYPTTTASVTIKYYPTFPTLTASVNPTINSYFHEPMVYGIASRAFEDLQDIETSNWYATKYENMLNQRIAQLSNYEEGNQRASQLFGEQDLLGTGGAVGDPNFM